MSTVPFFIVDAFCIPEESFSGNQAAVCLLTYDDEIPDDVKAKIGSEINLSETAFVAQAWNKTSERKSEYDFTLRWFTPASEIELCGHATLASARVLFDRMVPNDAKETTISFETKYKGILKATINWETKRISINFPLTPVTPFSEQDLSCLPQLLQYLIQPLDVNEIHSVNYASSTKYLFVRLHDKNGEKGLLELQPNFQQLSRLQGENIPFAIIVTVQGSTDDIHFYSRFFAPNLGVAEDPVTGSAHCALMSYWSKEFGATSLLGKQSSKRGGYVYCTIPESTPDRVKFEGLTKPVVQGELLL
ncbi:Phenazine biosynthesis-like domain-containing protein, partial [Pseudolycoriella hygida]